MRGIIRAPADESDLAAATLSTLEVILNIVDCITATEALLPAAVLALRLQEFLAESLVVGLLGGFLHHNLFPVIADLEDDPFCVLAQFEVVECGYALRCNGDSERYALAIVITEVA